MSGKTRMTQAKLKLSFVLLAAMGLAACDENGEFQVPSFGGDATNNTATAPSINAGTTNLTERDVEAPDIFSIADNGLWDGRPSLGGVWVAHPDVTDPERVIIRNTANGQFVIGALFRRERENPGPAFQVSSDAAEELGMLAGAPADLSVVALRREEAPAEVETTAVTDFDAPAEITATSLDSVGVTPAAPAEVPVVDTAAADVASAASAAIAAASAAAAAEAAAPAATPVAAPAPTSSLAKPFIQIGIFSVEANANSTASRLRSDGLSAQVLAQNSQGRNFWRVIVGPAPNEADRAAVLQKVKALGFSDAYFVSN